MSRELELWIAAGFGLLVEELKKDELASTGALLHCQLLLEERALTGAIRRQETAIWRDSICLNNIKVFG